MISETNFDAVLKERNILVTGAARGIGAAIARACAREGAKVLLLDHPTMSGPLENLASELRAVTILTDLSDARAVEIVAKKLWEHGPIHGVVHNAGITRDKSLKRMTPDQWSLVQKVNLDFPLALTEHLIAPGQRELLAKDASFVFLSSISGLAGNAGQTNYAATKSALIGYVRGLAARNFQTGRSLRFNAVAPGLIETPMTAAMPFAVREVARRLNSLNQGGIPEDVAEAVLFLTAPIGAEICGQTLRVCGQNLMGA